MNQSKLKANTWSRHGTEDRKHVHERVTTGHFRVSICLCVKSSCYSYENVFCLVVGFHINQTHFHISCDVLESARAVTNFQLCRSLFVHRGIHRFVKAESLAYTNSSTKPTVHRNSWAPNNLANDEKSKSKQRQAKKNNEAKNFVTELKPWNHVTRENKENTL